MLLEFESLRLRHFYFYGNLTKSKTPLVSGFFLFSRLTLSTGISLNRIGYHITNCIRDSGTRNDLGSYTVIPLFNSPYNVLVDSWSYTAWIFVIHRHVQNRYTGG